MATTIQQPPYKQDLIDQNNKMHPTWMNFMRDLFQRVGGLSAPSNNELDYSASITSLQTQITANLSSITTLQSQMTELTGLNQGPVL